VHRLYIRPDKCFKFHNISKRSLNRKERKGRKGKKKKRKDEKNISFERLWVNLCRLVYKSKAIHKRSLNRKERKGRKGKEKRRKDKEKSFRCELLYSLSANL
jgi:hypothetical protein